MYDTDDKAALWNDLRKYGVNRKLLNVKEFLLRIRFVCKYKGRKVSGSW